MPLSRSIGRLSRPHLLQPSFTPPKLDAPQWERAARYAVHLEILKRGRRPMRHDLDDIYQIALLAAWQAFEVWRPRKADSPWWWMVRKARWAINTHQKHRLRHYHQVVKLAEIMPELHHHDRHRDDDDGRWKFTVKTQRQAEVVALLAEGLTAKDVAKELGVDHSAVSIILRAIRSYPENAKFGNWRRKWRRYEVKGKDTKDNRNLITRIERRQHA